MARSSFVRETEIPFYEDGNEDTFLKVHERLSISKLSANEIKLKIQEFDESVTVSTLKYSEKESMYLFYTFNRSAPIHLDGVIEELLTISYVDGHDWCICIEYKPKVCHVV
jgi:hypothetical protein